MPRLVRVAKWLLISFICLIACAGLLAWYLHTDISDERMSRIKASPFFEDGAFFNQERQAQSDLGLAFLQEQFFGEQRREPSGIVPVEAIDAADFLDRPKPGLRAFWLGHASVLLELDGYRVLTDPVMSDRASPFQFMGPKKTHAAPVALAELANIDAVVISHNHYDHLDKATITHLASQGTRFFVPLGVGQYFEDWGIPAPQVSEMDWWDSEQVGRLTIMATPSRHYSSRGFFDYNATHWSSWSIVGDDHKVFYSGDTGYSKLFNQIGERLGPFDLSLVKIGSYGPGQAWSDIHMTPEEAVQVHLDVRAKRMLPVHWMTFNLALHDWREPIERAVFAAKAKEVDLVAPKVGQVVDMAAPSRNDRWWQRAE